MGEADPLMYYARWHKEPLSLCILFLLFLLFVGSVFFFFNFFVGL